MNTAEQPQIPAWGPRRMPVTLLGIAGALMSLAFQPGDIVRALMLSAAAALALSLLLTGLSRRVIGGVVALLGVGTVVAAWGSPLLMLSAAMVTMIGLVIVLVSGAWGGRETGRAAASGQRELWRSMDDGVDPTDDANPVV